MQVYLVQVIGGDLCFVILLLFLCIPLPSLLPCFLPSSCPSLPSLLPLFSVLLLLPFLSLPSLPSRRVHDTLRWSCICDRRSCFPSISRLYIFRGAQTCRLLTQLFPFWGMGDLPEGLSLLLMGFVQLKSCASQAFSKERISLEVQIDLVKDSFDEIWGKILEHI